MADVDFNLYLITDRLRLPKETSLLSQVESALLGGVRAVQLREKDLSAEELLPLAREMRQLTCRYSAKLLVNSSLETAVAVEADGVHLTSNNPPIGAARHALGPDALIGVSTHSLDNIKSAAVAGADFVTFGPVYPTPSKMNFGRPVGLENLAEACAASSIPVFALGGVTPEKLPELRESGCTYFACIGALQNAASPESAARSFLVP